MKEKEDIDHLLAEVERLKAENEALKRRLNEADEKGPRVKVPEDFAPIFDKAEQTVQSYFEKLKLNPEQGTISINQERYVLVKASSLSYGFFQEIKKLYRDKGEAEAFTIGQNFLFDIGHVLGKEDARDFHKSMQLNDPLERMAAGPVVFAHSGWAYVEILAESNPSPDENFFLKYRHPYSFEANSWIKKGKTSTKPVCILNAAYSSGWCEESYGLALTAVEISCKAKGDDHCSFIMAPPDRIHEYLEELESDQQALDKVPIFFERKQIEGKIKQSLAEKETLLREIHHRVKNNLQVITSMLNLEFNHIEDSQKIQEAVTRSRNRINSMALIHTKLYQSNDLSSVNFGLYIKELVQSIYESFPMQKNIKQKFNCSPAFFQIDLSINLGLIINELVTNAFKHAFKGVKNGTLSIELVSVKKDEYQLTISDNGIGIKNRSKSGNAEGLGLEIVNALAEQIEANLSIDTSNGLSYKLSFKKDKKLEEH
ncbi:MAG: histidine kinase dimerization/phosphoacceptor domain -containing protein [Vicingaceae bacterium]